MRSFHLTENRRDVCLPCKFAKYSKLIGCCRDFFSNSDRLTNKQPIEFDLSALCSSLCQYKKAPTELASKEKKAVDTELSSSVSQKKKIMTKKLVVVMGATGAQGGSLVQALLKDGSYAVRAVSRDPTSEASKKLAAQGVEVVKAHANNKDELVDAFKGAYAVFAVTNFWDKEILMNDHSLEEKQGKIIVDAVAETKPQHFLYSSLPYTAQISKNKYDKVVHFDGKARVEEYAKTKDINATFVHASFYMTNLIYFMPPQVNANGEVEWVGPMRPEAPVAMIDIPGDWGNVCLGVLKAGPAATKNLDVNVAGEYISFQQVVDTFTKVTGRKAVYKQIPREDYKNALVPTMGPIVSEEFVQMLEYFDEFGYFGGASIEPVKKFNPNMTTFAKWVEQSGYKGPQ